MEPIFSEEGQFFHIWCWLWTLILWITVVLILHELLRSSKSRSNSFFIFVGIAGVSYVVMLINSFSSPSFSFLGNFTQPHEVQKVIEEMYRSPPVIRMHFEAYHYKQQEYYEKTSNDTYVKKTRTQKVITHTASDNIRIMSYKDISQPLFLDTTALRPKINFLKLRLLQEINFANDGSEQDYKSQVAEFKYRNNWDSHYSYSEEKAIQGFKEFLFIPLTTSSTVSYVGRGWYTLFTFLSLTEFYKNYLNEYCRYHEYTITKEISTISINLFQTSIPLPSVRIVTPEYDNLYTDRGF